MNKRKRVLCLFSTLIIMLGIIAYPAKVAAVQTKQESLTLEQKLEQFINSRIKSEKLPGTSVAVVKDGRIIYQKCFGYADLKSKRKVNESSLFPLGQNNEAFTALAVLRLEQQKKLSLSDFVSKYLPWLKTSYEGKRNNHITIEELLYHTSGISNQPEYRLYNEKLSLRKIADQLGEIGLSDTPGDKYINSPLNYMILEEIIEKASGQTYKSYMKNELLPGLNLSHMRIGGNTDKDKAVKGYITNFSRLQEYNIKGIYENIKTEEIYSDIKDIGKWLKANLNGSDAAFNKLHQPDFYSNGQSGTFRAIGWNSAQDRKSWLSSTGNLPDYSSFLAINTKDRIGVGILTNRNSANIQSFGTGIISILNNEEPWKAAADVYQQLDRIAVAAIWFSLPLIAIFTFFLCLSLMQFICKKRRFIGLSVKSTASLIMSLTFLCGLIFCLDQIYYILIGPVTTGYIDVWLPKSLVIGMRLFKYAVVAFYLYFQFIILFPKPKSKNLIPTAIISVVSGFGNALVIFIINMAFGIDEATRLRLMVFFIVALIIYVFGQRMVRMNLIRVTSNYLCDMRMNIINKLLNTYFSKMESIEPWKILVVLNNDTETISNFINTAISGVTGVVTLLFGMLYMGLINPYGLLIASVVSFAAAACYTAAALSTNKIWEKARDMQSLFIKYVNDLLGGFKELKLNSARKKDFHYDVKNCSEVYRDKRIEFDFKFANVYVIGELMFTLVVGVIAFIFPIVFKDISNDNLRSYIFVFFYLIGPLHGILAVVPNLIQVKISWKRVKSLTKEISSLETVPELAPAAKGLPGEFTLELRNAAFSYQGENGENFKIGPMKLSFKSGEITFLTGGNGSGKSTLAKLITGLYHTDEGEICINGESVEPERLNELFAAVFSDYHMFEKLYGIDVEQKVWEIDECLKKLRIADKLHINPDGTLSNICLSTGQKKRVALMVSYLENRPIYLFDEWAADQDPQFRRYFYHTLLPELKAQGKCVIAVTHDDRYFETADKVIKLEYGKVVEEKNNNKEFANVGEEVS